MLGKDYYNDIHLGSGYNFTGTFFAIYLLLVIDYKINVHDCKNTVGLE